MLMAKVVDELAVHTAGKKSLAVEAFARALRQLPTILADNGGFDSSELVSHLRSAHAEGKSTYGLSTQPPLGRGEGGGELFRRHSRPCLIGLGPRRRCAPPPPDLWPKTWTQARSRTCVNVGSLSRSS